MKKIRINELARELEVKAHEILDRLPELGVTEKKTHSSSIDEDVALKLKRIYGFPADEVEAEEAPGPQRGARETEEGEAAGEQEPPVSGPAVPALRPEALAPVSTQASPETEPERRPETPAPH